MVLGPPLSKKMGFSYLFAPSKVPIVCICPLTTLNLKIRRDRLRRCPLCPEGHRKGNVVALHAGLNDNRSISYSLSGLRPGIRIEPAEGRKRAG
jgi:hypothetical protein